MVHLLERFPIENNIVKVVDSDVFTNYFQIERPKCDVINIVKKLRVQSLGVQTFLTIPKVMWGG